MNTIYLWVRGNCGLQVLEISQSSMTNDPNIQLLQANMSYKKSIDENKKKL